MTATHDWQQLFAEQARTEAWFYHRLARRIVGDGAAAEDACQRAFLQAWRQRDRIQRAEAIRAYLAQTVVNECLQWRRKQQTERRALNQLTAQHDSATQHHHDPGNDMAQREWVWRAMEHLHEPTRTVVILRVMHGLTGKEVSQRLDCSPSEISRRLHHGLDTLRTTLNAPHPQPQTPATPTPEAD